MNVKILIDCIVRQTTVLMAQLATRGGLRAPLAHVANQVFLELARELDAQGVSRKVSADMFGMALRTYQRRVQWLSESSTDRGRTLWEAVLDYLGPDDVRSRAEILHRFRRDDEALVRGVLHDLTESGLVFASGSGPRQVYRCTTKAEQLQMQRTGADEGFPELLWAYIYREGPVGRSELDSFAPGRSEELEAVLERLEQEGRVQRDADGTLRASSLEVLLGAPVGWEAAVYDHYQALVATLCQRLSPDAAELAAQGRVGGSTFTLDVWDGHPMAEEVYATLGRLRQQLGELFERVETYNAQHGVPDPHEQVVVYGGQCVLSRERT